MPSGHVGVGLEGDVERDWAVIRAGDFRVDGGLFDEGHKAMRGAKINDAPAYVSVTCSSAKTQPTVGVFPIGVEGAEGVGKTALQQSGEAGAFFIGKSGAEVVGIGAGYVDFFVRYIEISAEDDGFSSGQIADIGFECGVPLLSIGQASQFILRIGGVAAHEVEPFEFHGGYASFLIVLGEPHACRYGDGLRFGKEEHSGVSRAYGRIPHAVRPCGQPEIAHLFRFGFDLLKTNDIGRQSIHFFRQAFAQGGAQAVHIPADKFHTGGMLSHFVCRVNVVE